MDELFNILSSSARLKKKQKEPKTWTGPVAAVLHQDDATGGDDVASSSRDRTGKRDMSDEKRLQIHKEQVAAFRRSMNIRVANKHDPDLPDPISSFRELETPKWWTSGEEATFLGLYRAIQRNVEAGRWKEPTPIQMQAIPALAERRDLIGAAPTGSGKSGAFIIPALLMSCAPYGVFYGRGPTGSIDSPKRKKGKKNKKQKSVGREGEIRALLLAPSLELAAQLHREVQRIGSEMPGGGGGKFSMLLSKSNAAHIISGSAGGKHGLDVLVATPLRLVDCIEKGLRLDSVRMIVLDEADRLLDAADGKAAPSNDNKTELGGESKRKGGDALESSDNESNEEQTVAKATVAAAGHPEASGSSHSKTFLAQMDIILSEIPATAVRALFSATVTPTVRHLSESILRNPVDLTIQASNTPGGANPDIEQQLTFVGREEGKLLAIRQLVQRGQLRPPVIVFVESQERAQALFEELLYDNIHVDVIHAGRSKSARENAVARFRRGDTWVLICTDLVARGVDFRAVNMVINYDLPESGITYVHRIGRTGRAGRKGKAITLFTEMDFDNLRTIANIMKQSGCKVEDWMLSMPKKRQNKKNNKYPRHRGGIDTTPKYDKMKKRKKQQMIQQSKAKHHKQDEQHSATT